MGVPKLLITVGTGAGGGGGMGGTLFEATLASHLASRLRRICAVVPGWIPGFDDIAERYKEKLQENQEETHRSRDLEGHKETRDQKHVEKRKDRRREKQEGEYLAAHREPRRGERVKFLKMEKPVPMSESLKAGWTWVVTNLKPDGVMISLADKPLVAAETIDIIIDAYGASDREICVPTYRGTRGHPVIISSSLGAEVMALEGDRGAGQVLAARRDRITEVAVASDSVVFDVDSSDDVEALKARLGAIGRP